MRERRLSSLCPGGDALADASETEKPRKKKKWFVLAAAGVLVVGAAGVVTWQIRGHAAPGTPEPTHEAEGPTGMITPEPFLANLADRGVSRFAKVTVRLVVESKEEAEVLAEDIVKQARLRSAILELLTEQTADYLVTSEGKEDLKKAIAARAAKTLGCKVHDVLFTDFVVQF